MTADAPPCLDRALRLLARRPHFRRELEEKLAARGYPRSEIEVTLARLESERLVDDAETARRFAAERLRRGPLGRRRLRVELLRRGAPEDLVEAVLRQAVPDDDREAALEAARRWRTRNPSADAGRLARYLDRQGFTSGAVMAALERWREEG